MVETETVNKKLQVTPNGTPYVYLDKKYINALGLKAKQEINIEFDFTNKKITMGAA